jgi:CHAD domain-containing protein
MATSAVMQKRAGLAYWMQEVLNQCEKASASLSSEPVHDLRTSLRRCRSLADGIMVFDPHPAWKKMKRAGKQLFSSLGELRDTHVLQEWVQKLSPEGDVTGKFLTDFMIGREESLKETAIAALQQFDRKQWKCWANELPSRAAKISTDSPAFAYLALEKWQDAHALHRRALRNRSNVSYHQLRIGLKRLRYTIENFLPRLHGIWGQDLKELQDILGEVHDLDVLWETAAGTKAFPDSVARTAWRVRVQEEKRQRIAVYRSKMVGRESLWHIWRAELPRVEELRSLGLARFQIRAAFLDTDVAHAKHVARLAVQLYDGLPVNGVLRGPKREEYRYILQLAAMMHDIGRSRTNRGHHKASARLIRKLSPPPGWAAEEIRLAAFVARYHRGALPAVAQQSFVSLAQSKQRLVKFLAGILRFACACDRQHDAQIRRIEVDASNSVFMVRAEGYTESTPLAEHLAAARHLLELTYGRPVFVMPMPDPGQIHAA